MNFSASVDLILEHRWFLSDRGQRQLALLIKAAAGALSLKGVDLELNRQSRLFAGKQVEDSYFGYRAGSVGVLDIQGVLTAQHYGALSQDLALLETDSTISSIVLALDTPGGMVTGLSGFAEQIARSSKTIIAHPIGSAASAGYFLASQANEIVAVDTADVGSIGTVASLMDMSGLFETIGFKETEIVSEQSPRKRPDLSTLEGQQDIQALVNADAEIFIEAVAQGRGVSADTVREDFGQGAEFIAGEALRRGMIDGIQSTRDLLTELNSGNNTNFKAASSMAAKGKREMDEKEVAALKDQAVKDALVKERARVAAIDAVADKYAQDDQSVRDAVRVIVECGRSDASMTAETVEVEASRVALDAMRKAAAQRSAAADKLAGQLARVQDPDQPAAAEVARKAKIDGLVAGMQAQGERIN
jgi:ClpP class serine protease